MRYEQGIGILQRLSEKGAFVLSFCMYKKKGCMHMKTTLKAISLVLSLVVLLSFTACGAQKTEGLWKDATYTTDTTLGDGEKTVKVEVKAEDKVVTFTVKTDAKTVGAALLENALIAGEEGTYGLYIKKVNGITADYDTDKAYWAFYVNGEYAMSGVDSTNIDESAVYSLVYAK